MSTKRRGSMTLEEFETQLKAEGRLDEYIARKQEKNRLRTERIARHRKEQMQLLEELRATGLEIQLVSDLINTAAPYPQAIPILLKHLLMPYSDVTRETIARALAVREARYAWPTLVAEYRKAPMGISEEGFRRAAKDGLACAVAATVTDETMDELVALAKDRSLGESRLLLLSELRKSKSSAAKQALAELATDADLEKEIASWKPKRTKRS